MPDAPIEFVVIKRPRTVQPGGELGDPVFLVALWYDPYNKGGQRDPLFTESVAEAFVFTERVAAEVAAVFIGGVVGEVSNA
jgi:hypothetical protein